MSDKSAGLYPFIREPAAVCLYALRSSNPHLSRAKPALSYLRFARASHPATERVSLRGEFFPSFVLFGVGDKNRAAFAEIGELGNGRSPNRNDRRNDIGSETGATSRWKITRRRGPSTVPSYESVRECLEARHRATKSLAGRTSSFDLRGVATPRCARRVVSFPEFLRYPVRAGSRWLASDLRL